MLDNSVIKKIEEFVCQKPRSVHEIAGHIGKNWRTADRYIDFIEKEFGTLSTRVFRAGTRGALKVAYWSAVEKVKSSFFQEQLEKKIFMGRKKEDFSAFDIYQFVSDKDKKVNFKNEKSEEEGELESLRELILSAKKNIFIFSGNLSFTNFKNEKIDILKLFDEQVKKGVKIKIVSRVDIAGKSNIENILSLNNKYGKDNVEIRHCEQPLRAIVVDDKFFSMKEIHAPTGRKGELDKKVFLFYEIKDSDWVSWLTRIFWKMFSSSIDARKRIEQLDKLPFKT